MFRLNGQCHWQCAAFLADKSWAIIRHSSTEYLTCRAKPLIITWIILDPLPQRNCLQVLEDTVVLVIGTGI